MLLKLLLILAPVASAQETSFVNFLQTAWELSPTVRGEVLQNDASNEFISSARGKYLPHVSLDAIDTTGFPASNAELGVGGLMGSPFRSGLAGGIVVNQTVYDFGRIQSFLERAKAEKSLNLARLAEDKFRFLSTAGRLYLTCARVRSLQQHDTELMSWAKINLKETARFTKTGQRSIVDNSLVQTEVNSLNLELEQLHKFEDSLNGQMKMYGSKGGCQSLSGAWKIQVPEALQVEEPSLLLAKAQIELSQSSYEEAKASQLPKLNVMASSGGMDDARLVDQQNYSAGIGLVFPIWNGGEDARRERAYKSQTEYQGENLKAAQLEYATRLKNLQDELSRDQEALTVIEKNLEQVEKTIKLASKRYRTLEGTLIDVREAFKQLRDLGLERIQVMSALADTSLQVGMLRTR